MTNLDDLRATIAAAMRDDDDAIDRIIDAIDNAPSSFADPIGMLYRDLSLSDRNTFLLDFDYCPIHDMHLEICADDDLPECAPIRAILDIEIAAQRAILELFRP